MAGNNGNGVCTTCLILDTATFIVKGTLRNQYGKPLVNYKVVILRGKKFRKVTRTNELGDYRFNVLPRGKYVLKVPKRGSILFPSRAIPISIENSDVVKDIVI